MAEAIPNPEKLKPNDENLNPNPEIATVVAAAVVVIIKEEEATIMNGKFIISPKLIRNATIDGGEKQGEITAVHYTT